MMATHSYWYDRAYFKGPKSIAKRINIDPHGCIRINNIQRAYNIDPAMLDGCLYCPGCRRARLFCAKFPYNQTDIYLKRLPSSSHIPGCKYNKQEHISHRGGSNNYKSGKITNKNIKNLLDEALKKISNKIKNHSKTNSGGTTGGKKEGPSIKSSSIKKGSHKKTKYRFLNWDHDFKYSDNGKDCILFGLIKNINIDYKSQDYIDRDSGKEKSAYKTIINIRTGNKCRNIYGINWKKSGKLADKKDSINIKGLIKFVAMCTINYPYRDFKHIKGSLYYKKIK